MDELILPRGSLAHVWDALEVFATAHPNQQKTWPGFAALPRSSALVELGFSPLDLEFPVVDETASHVTGVLAPTRRYVKITKSEDARARVH
jgi:hypothetical protein